MADHTLTMIDTTAIQAYIFGSNRLRDNVGASQLVADATSAWVAETLRDLGATNIALAAKDFIDDRCMFENHPLDAELLSTGGGNAIILFRTATLATRWTTSYTRLLLQRAPGLSVVVVHSDPFTWDPGGRDMPNHLETLKDRLNVAKQTRRSSAPLLGLGVTATCQSTGLVAVDTHKDGKAPDCTFRRVSSEVQAKVSEAIYQRSHQRFQDIFADFRRLELKLPADFDDLGRRKGEQSYIAVVHADGNGLGKRFEHLHTAGCTNRDYVQHYRRLSNLVNRAAQDALTCAVAPLINEQAKLIPPYTERKMLPFRPLVYGGDDVTFVCDGALGLWLAARYLAAWEQQTQDKLTRWRAEYDCRQEPIPAFLDPPVMTACAGVALVKTHYPFARAYALSEELCQHAKRLSRSAADNPSPSALDWHIATSGLLGGLDDIRKREYTVKTGALAMRPIMLHAAAHPWRTWLHVQAVVKALQQHDAWAGKRNKIMRLHEILRQGASATKQFLHLYTLAELPGYDEVPGDVKTTGWHQDDSGSTCAYFDAIEALDFFADEHWEIFHDDKLFHDHSPAQ